MQIQMKKNAYTLIETLFVVAILAIVAVLGIGTYRQYAANDKVDAAVAQIDAIKTAAVNFYLSNQYHWPLIANTSDWTNFTTNFIKGVTQRNNVISNPWGYPVTTQTYNATLNDNTFVAGYHIQMQVPSETIAKRIAQKIAFVTIDKVSNNFFVSVNQPNPEQLVSQAIMLMTAGQVDKKYNLCPSKSQSCLTTAWQNKGTGFYPRQIPVTSFNCPAGYKAGLFLTVSDIQADRFSTDAANIAKYGVVSRVFAYGYLSPDAFGTQTVCSPSETIKNNWSCNLYLIYNRRLGLNARVENMGQWDDQHNKPGNIPNSDGYVSYNYIGYCEPGL